MCRKCENGLVRREAIWFNESQAAYLGGTKEWEMGTIVLAFVAVSLVAIVVQFSIASSRTKKAVTKSDTDN
jgi:hypothetical protein